MRGLRHGFQGGVPGLMPEPAIVVLEEVEVEHQQGERRARRDALHRFLKRPAVVYAGQRIPEAEVSILVPSGASWPERVFSSSIWRLMSGKTSSTSCNSRMRTRGSSEMECPERMVRSA